MKWSALKDYRCPSCGGQLEDIDGMHTCSNVSSCTFRITDAKLSALLPQISKRRPTAHTPSEEENISALNNL